MNHAVKIELDVYVATRYTSVGGLECLLQQTLSSLCRPIGKHDTGPSQNSLGAQNLRSPRYLVLNQVIETQRLESFAVWLALLPKLPLEEETSLQVTSVGYLFSLSLLKMREKK
jgi:hypothetical protein